MRSSERTLDPRPPVNRTTETPLSRFIAEYNHPFVHRHLIIPAAGLGSRLASPTPKVLVEVNGRAMVDHLIRLFQPFVDAAVVVAHPSFSDRVRHHLNTSARGLTIDVVEQPAPTGMLDAILAAADAVANAAPDQVWIVWCDQVGLLPETLRQVADASVAQPAPDLVLPTVIRPDPYIHFERETRGGITAVRQRREGDEMPPLGESDAGLFSLSAQGYREFQAFSRTAGRGSGTGERNFLPFIPWLAHRRRVVTVACADPREAVGVNTPQDLADVEAWLKQRSGSL